MGDGLPEPARAAKPSPAVAACSEAEAIEILESAEEGMPGAAEDVSFDGGRSPLRWTSSSLKVKTLASRRGKYLI